MDFANILLSYVLLSLEDVCYCENTHPAVFIFLVLSLPMQFGAHIWFTFRSFFAVPWAPGGSKFTRNPTPPSGVSYCDNSFLHTLYRITFSLSNYVLKALHLCYQPALVHLKQLLNERLHWFFFMYSIVIYMGQLGVLFFYRHSPYDDCMTGYELISF